MPVSADQHATAMLIRKLESIAILSQAERAAIEGLTVRTRVLDGRHDIMREGDQPSQCCLIVSGWACRYKLIGGGRRQILSFHVAGDIPDLLSLHLHTMDHSLSTMRGATVAFIPHDNLRELTADFPSICALLWRDSLIDGSIFREWMTGIGRRSALERIAHLFCELYVKLQAVGLVDHNRLQLPLTQTDLADALGLTSVHVNRVLKELRGRGLITLRGSMLEIAEWDELRRLSEFDPTYLHLQQPGE